MRILWVKMGGLWPLNTGGRQRTFQILSALARAHDVRLLTSAGPDDDIDGLRKALEPVVRVDAVPLTVPKRDTASFAMALGRSWLSRYPVDLWKWRHQTLRRRVAGILDRGEADVVVADFLFAVPNVPIRSRTPMAFFAHNVEHQIWKRLHDVESRPWRRALLALEWRKMRRCEARACESAALTIAVSDDDRRRFQALAPRAEVAVVPTGVDADYFRPDPAREVPARLVFSGSMDWYPNEDAVLWFASEILPRIRQTHPAASLTIVGRNPGPRVRELAAAQPGIEVTGTVDDVRPFLSTGSIYVVPLRVGGGTRLKIPEAMAMGQPVVSTRVGAEGLGLIAGQHFVEADEAGEFAAAVTALLDEPERRRVLGDTGRQLVEREYSWASVARTFGSYLQEIPRHDATAVNAPRRVAVSRP